MTATHRPHAPAPTVEEDGTVRFPQRSGFLRLNDIPKMQGQEGMMLCLQGGRLSRVPRETSDAFRQLRQDPALERKRQDALAGHAREMKRVYQEDFPDEGPTSKSAAKPPAKKQKRSTKADKATELTTKLGGAYESKDGTCFMLNDKGRRMPVERRLFYHPHLRRNVYTTWCRLQGRYLFHDSEGAEPLPDGYVAEDGTIVPRSTDSPPSTPPAEQDNAAHCEEHFDVESFFADVDD
jgi:hypothetical protein